MMETPNQNTTAFDIIKNYWSVLVALGALFVNIVLTWKNVGDNQIMIKELKDQVSRQYQIQREMNEKTNKEVDALKLEAAYQKGYNEKELKK